MLVAVAARAEASGARIDRTDGVRVSEPDGWWLLRASGTEAKLTARCEAATAEALDSLKSRLGEALRSQGLDVDEL